MSCCPDCQAPLCSYQSGIAEIKICWNCGYYESDSSAYFESPELFRDIVRKNPQRFIRKFLKVILADEKKQLFRDDGEVTEPFDALNKGGIVFSTH